MENSSCDKAYRDAVCSRDVKARVTNVIFHFRNLSRFVRKCILGAPIREHYFKVAQFPPFRTGKSQSRRSGESFIGKEL